MGVKKQQDAPNEIVKKIALVFMFNMGINENAIGNIIATAAVFVINEVIINVIIYNKIIPQIGFFTSII
jgi:hypothetical protein